MRDRTPNNLVWLDRLGEVTFLLVWGVILLSSPCGRLWGWSEVNETSTVPVFPPNLAQSWVYGAWNVLSRSIIRLDELGALLAKVSGAIPSFLVPEKSRSLEWTAGLDIVWISAICCVSNCWRDGRVVNVDESSKRRGSARIPGCKTWWHCRPLFSTMGAALLGGWEL